MGGAQQQQQKIRTFEQRSSLGHTLSRFEICHLLIQFTFSQEKNILDTNTDNKTMFCNQREINNT